MEEAGENLGAAVASSSASTTAESLCFAAAIFRRLNSLRLLSSLATAVF